MSVLRESNYSASADEPVFWFNLKTLKVEVGPQSSAKNRVGPFATRGEAENALQLIREKSAKWRESEADA